MHDEHLVNKHILTLVMTLQLERAVGDDFDRSILNKLGECQISQFFIFFILFFSEGTHCQREASCFTHSHNYDWCCIAKTNQ